MDIIDDYRMNYCYCGKPIEWWGMTQCRDCEIRAREELKREAWMTRNNENISLLDYERMIIAPRMQEKMMQKRWLFGTDTGSTPDRTVAANMAVSPTGRLWNIDRMEFQNIPVPKADSVTEMMNFLKQQVAAALAVPLSALSGPDLDAVGEIVGVKRTDADRLLEFEALLVQSEALLNHFS